MGWVGGGEEEEEEEEEEEVGIVEDRAGSVSVHFGAVVNIEQECGEFCLFRLTWS